jgi:low affinity Fe/Cu permease
VFLWALPDPLFDLSNALATGNQHRDNSGDVSHGVSHPRQTNRSSAALQLKLDELIRANHNASNAFLTLEDLTLEELERERIRYEELAQRARARLNPGKSANGVSSVSLQP